MAPRRSGLPGGGGSEAGTAAPSHLGPGDAGARGQPLAGPVAALAAGPRRPRPRQHPQHGEEPDRGSNPSCNLQLAVETGATWFPLTSVSLAHRS